MGDEFRQCQKKARAIIFTNCLGMKVFTVYVAFMFKLILFLSLFAVACSDSKKVGNGSYKFSDEAPARTKNDTALMSAEQHVENEKFDEYLPPEYQGKGVAQFIQDLNLPDFLPVISEPTVRDEGPTLNLETFDRSACTELVKNRVYPTILSAIPMGSALANPFDICGIPFMKFDTQYSQKMGRLFQVHKAWGSTLNNVSFVVRSGFITAIELEHIPGSDLINRDTYGFVTGGRFATQNLVVDSAQKTKLNLTLAGPLTNWFSRPYKFDLKFDGSQGSSEIQANLTYRLPAADTTLVYKYIKHAVGDESCEFQVSQKNKVVYQVKKQKDCRLFGGAANQMLKY